MKHTAFRTPGGEDLVVMPRAEFDALQDMLDAASHAHVMAEVADGRQLLLSSEDVATALAEATPLAFWRKRRGLTQKALAKAAGISQSYLASLESGVRKGDPKHYLHFSRALRVRMEDLVTD